MTFAARSPDPVALEPGQRNHSRARLNLPARLVTFREVTQCTLVDVSCSGAKLRSNQCPNPGESALVDGLPVELFGTVRWVDRGFFGVEFDDLLPLDRVVALRHFADEHPERQKQAVVNHARRWVTGVY